MSALPGATEYRMEISPYGDGAESLTGPQADARRIQSVLITQGLVGDSGHGADIQSYIGEILDDQQVSKLNSVVSDVVRRACPGVVLAASAVQAGPDGKSLVFGFTLGAKSPGEEPYSFAVQVLKGVTTLSIREFRLGG